MSSADPFDGMKPFHSIPRNVMARKTVLVERVQTSRGESIVPPGSWLVIEEVGKGLFARCAMQEEAFIASFQPGSSEKEEPPVFQKLVVTK